ncbi:MAG: zinc-binding dehydrogenase [Coprococcus sp.]
MFNYKKRPHIIGLSDEVDAHCFSEIQLWRLNFYECGTIVIAATMALKYFGCSKVIISDISDFRLDIVRNLDFTVCNSAKENLQEKAKEYFGKSAGIHGETADVDIYIDAAGAKELIETYQEMGKFESGLVVVAVLAGFREINVLDITYSQHAIIGSGGYMPEDVMDLFAIMQDERWDIERIITDGFKWERLPDAIERASDSQNAFNVVIQY